MKSKLRSKNRTNYGNPLNPKLQLISINRRGTIFENIPLGTRMTSTIFIPNHFVPPVVRENYSYL